MNQKYIWLVTIVLCISLFGLILVQINYFQSASKLKEEQFSLTVSKALDQVVSKLEHDESVKMILKGNSSNHSNIAGHSELTTGSSTISFTMDQKHDKAILSISHENKKNIPIAEGPLKSNLAKFQEQFNKALTSSGNYGEYANKLKNANLKLSERVDLNALPALIEQKLKDNGIKLNFEYAVKVNGIKFETASKNYFRNPSVEKYTKPLFPNDLYFARTNILHVYFPAKQQHMLQSYTMLLPSFILTLVLILCSAFTIFIIFRQKKLSKIKNDFINNMTHEFKTPISTISLASQMLKDNSVATTQSFIDHIAKIINDESKRLTYQVEKVLQMAVFNEARMKLKLKPISVHKIIQNLLPNFTIRAEDKSGNMYQNLDASQDTIMADEVHVSNVISNLLDNAIKYCKDNPEISISTRNKDKGIVISITDNGIGISKEDQRMVFERFFRVHTGNVHDVKGFGLGLSYVKKVVDAHHGEVNVDSVLDKGSKFEVYLPLKK
ncbi:sensor histidine kinase [Marinifilum flexuosum]|uniref:sensor histidine kinase n=1 Tax=Marinifilum flexuosum TaxID=1117708 RepID=UPI0024951195|nr:HAMP domain-containing sensor histidine kinase [Marinifilum flexuosum]